MMGYIIERNEDSPSGAKVIHFEILMKDDNGGEQPRYYNIELMTDVFMRAMEELQKDDEAITEVWNEKQQKYAEDNM
jgi:hypothetical protein